MQKINACGDSFGMIKFFVIAQDESTPGINSKSLMIVSIDQMRRERETYPFLLILQSPVAGTDQSFMTFASSIG